MTGTKTIAGRMAALRIENLDTDQIMPKQFLHGIDKSGLARGVLHDLRFDPAGHPRPGFVLNRPEHGGADVLVAGANFGCGSSREHAVWGLLEFGVRAVVAPSFGEIFYSNAMNNGLLLVTLPQHQVAALMDAADDAARSTVRIDVAAQQLHASDIDATFDLLPRHRRMLLEGVDVIGLTLAHAAPIVAFAQAHWSRQPWLRDVARITRDRLDASGRPHG